MAYLGLIKRKERWGLTACGWPVMILAVIAGAGIDVHPGEPPSPDYELLGLDNALLTPHLAWYSEEGGWDIRYMIIDDLKAFVEGKPPKSVLNPEVLEKSNLRMKLSK